MEAKVKTERHLLTCLRCGHIWLSNKEKPKVCARCRNPYWDIPRKETNNDNGS